VNAFRERSAASGGSVDLFRRTTRGTLTAIVLVAVLLASGVIGLALTGSGSGGSSSGAAAAASATPVAAPLVTPAPQGPVSGQAFTTHGDLFVNGVVTIAPTFGSQTYYQGGNITVNATGTLIIKNTTISFVQYIGSTGTAEARLAHVFHFIDKGTVEMYNSSITTDVLQVNGYAKLPLTLANGTMTLVNSTLDFPGWVTVNGTASVLTLNGSQIAPNPNVPGLIEPPILKGDDAFAPDIEVGAGAKMILDGSNVSGLYADNQTQNGTAGPSPLNLTDASISNLSAENYSLTTSNNSFSLAQDWAYPSGVAGGVVEFRYSNYVAEETQTTVTAWYNGVPYALGTADFLPLVLNAIENLSILTGPTSLTHAIDVGGMLAYLNSTGAFGVTPGKIWLEFSDTTGPSLNPVNVSVYLYPELSYNIAVTGKGSQITTVDSSIALTFGLTPASPYSLVPPLPWHSNKLELSMGATGYLASLEVPTPYSEVFASSGAIVADATSQAYLYRWSAFNLTGLGGVLRVSGGHATAYYAYSGVANNATANDLNNLTGPTANNTAIAAYLRYWDGLQGITTYGTSGIGGVAYLLLASNVINGASGPNGYFLGDYKIVITVASIAASKSFGWGAISSYPAGVAVNTPGYGLPDYGPSFNFPGYFAALSVTSVAIEANGTVATSVQYGQVLTLAVTFSDAGPAPILTIGTSLFYNATESTLLGVTNTTVDLNTTGQTEVIDVPWAVSDSVTGLHGTFINKFQVNFTWNERLVSEGGGSGTFNQSVTIVPSPLHVTFRAPVTTALVAQQYYQSTGTIQFNGTEAATITLYATPSSGGTAVVLGVAYSLSGPGYRAANYTIDWSTVPLSAGTDYSLTLTASYNGVTKSVVSAGPYAIPSTAAPPAKPFYERTFLGIPVWLWIVIAALIAVGAFLLLRFARRGAAGKLVECGECGALIPEHATTCPKCGAEFESELVRCSRCSATIPADSAYCPECSAQLLGKAGEAGDDPERQGYEDFANRYRAEAKKELGENYTEGAFWDWWKRQASFTPFSQWKLQQGQGTARAGMSAPPAGPASPPPRPAAARPPMRPPGGGGAARAGPAAAPVTPAPTPTPAVPPATTPPPAAPGGLKPCPSCGKEIPPEYLVCPFCGSVTQ
jgi:RNA polymerase subunit RPABC4/transcription elongation factor Spt4